MTEVVESNNKYNISENLTVGYNSGKMDFTAGEGTLQKGSFLHKERRNEGGASRSEGGAGRSLLCSERHTFC